MKKQMTTTLAAAVLASGMAMPASAGVDATVGLTSEYIFRGTSLGDAGAYFDLSYSVAGFYLGTWMINDGVGANDGLETDFYMGYGLETEGGFTFDVMLNGYEYTYTSDKEYELGVALGYAGFGFATYYGRDFQEGVPSGVDEDYDFSFTTLSWSGDVFGVLLGHYQVVDLADEADSEAAGVYKGDKYSYLELSAGGEVAGLDMGVAIGRQFNIKSGDVDGLSVGSEYIVLDVSKSFSF